MTYKPLTADVVSTGNVGKRGVSSVLLWGGLQPLVLTAGGAAAHWLQGRISKALLFFAPALGQGGWTDWPGEMAEVKPCVVCRQFFSEELEVRVTPPGQHRCVSPKLVFRISRTVHETLLICYG